MKLLITLFITFSFNGYAGDIQTDEFCQDVGLLIYDLESKITEYDQKCIKSADLLIEYGELLGKYKSLHESCHWRCSPYKQRVQETEREIDQLKEKNRRYCVQEKNILIKKLGDSLEMRGDICK